MTVLDYQKLNIKEYFDLQHLYIKHLEQEQQKALNNQIVQNSK